MKFSLQKKGYNIGEVDVFVNSVESDLKAKEGEISTLHAKISELQSREGAVSVALTAAVEKAGEIEKSSKNVYDLKIKQLTVLYSKYEKLLNGLLEKYPEIEDISNIKQEIENFKKSVKSVAKEDFDIAVTEISSQDPMRALLNKVKKVKKETASQVSRPVHIERKTKAATFSRTELEKLEEKSSLIKPISDIKIASGEKFENPVDKFLSDETFESKNAFIKKLAGGITGTEELKDAFDLKEAVNPKDDLSEIMKAFDFYDNK